MEYVSRNSESIKCDCGGYAQRVPCNEEELNTLGCERERIGGYECCARAFECCLCNKRHGRKAEAPEMN